MPENKPHIHTAGEQFHDHGGNLEQLFEHMPDEEAFYKASDIFQQLCDPTRLRILWLLAHCEACVLNVAVTVGMSTSAVSHHLRILRQTGLIVNRRAGKEVYYKLADTRTARLIHKMIDDVFEMNCPQNKL